MTQSTTKILQKNEQDLLLKVARIAVEGAANQEPEATTCAAAAEVAHGLAELNGATFVTVYVKGRLNGCLGSIQTRRTLVADVAHNAYNAAASDPRFPSLRADQLPDVTLEISVLSPLEQMPVLSFAELLETVQPGVDGLLIEAGHHRATLLPSVWEDVPEASVFLMHLWEKANLEPESWPDEMTVHRYTTQEFSDQ